ncbi:hypothetical protein SEUCBS139899_007732 [Sporothrix eucalyptigena]|uniref:Fe2OG dioxygenase domain-containing protein n=1 Tax=Sporothrix eucalyptigena TaxID=1812306 RepID=A0ABP0B3L6_9PEZI
MVTETATITAAVDAPWQQLCRLPRRQGRRLSGSSMEKTFESIPQIDFANMDVSLADRQALAAQVNATFTESGFLYSCSHSISKALQKEVLGVMQAFFTLPAEEKVKFTSTTRPRSRATSVCSKQNSARTPAATSRRSSTLATTRPSPSKTARPGLTCLPEQWHYAHQPVACQPSNFRGVLYQYHAAVMSFLRQLLQIIALALDLEEDYFDALTTFPMAGLRPLYYPPRELAPDISIGAHADYSWLTVVNQLTDAPALEVLNANAHWVCAPPLPNTLVINDSDFLERATNSMFVLTFHRVVNKTAGVARYSLLFFSVPATTP